MDRPRKTQIGLLAALFAVSGFTGLVYESVWSHYLKLMLGHAALAQTLVLSIFMGGMALGAWWTGRRSRRIARPLRAYAWVEAAIGVTALLFHWVFVGVLGQLLESWLPGVAGTPLASLVPWAVATLLILPPSVLLGATFPLMCAGLIRRRPEDPGRGLATLYFTNSLGAAIGALTSGFLLVPQLGLPGAMTLAGVVNAAIALVVLRLAGDEGDAPLEVAPRAPEDTADAAVGTGRVLLLAAAATGAASFAYEIGWIRLLSLVLGSTEQAFELMLSAFISGLALGGLWIRRRADRLASPMAFAGRVQVWMGVAAAASLPLYDATYALMGWLVQNLEKTDRGYTLFQLGSHGIALAVMLPATILAGMTLPLFTLGLMRQGASESAIGRVYAANTVGAIVGVLGAVHLGMPLLGARGTVLLGAFADGLLGLLLLAWATKRAWSRELGWSATLVAALTAVVALGLPGDLRKAASGVYRTGTAEVDAASEVIFHRDGKTATVALVQDEQGRIRLTTNGKPDAQINPGPGEPAPDEVTQALLAVLPLALHPEARTVANIGYGSGMTTHVLLGSDHIERIDTIEIEPAMIEASRAFGSRVERAWTDPRSRLHVADAKTFFATAGEAYDIIISEPSNPWVSGVSSLFSEEFYRVASRALESDGVLVQWLQLYETDLELLGSVFKALGRQFDDYVVFSTDNANIVVVASSGRRLGEVSERLFSYAELTRELQRVGIRSAADLELRRIGSRAVLQAVFEAGPAPVNSDYYPYLAHAAPRARFLGLSAVELTRLHVAPVPLLELLDPYVRRGNPTVTPAAVFTPSRAAISARSLMDEAMWNVAGTASSLHRDTRASPGRSGFSWDGLRSPACDGLQESEVRIQLIRLAASLNPYLRGGRLVELWDTVERHPCVASRSDSLGDWARLHRALAVRDRRGAMQLAAGLLETPGAYETPREVEYLMAAGLASALALGEVDEARRFGSRFAIAYPADETPPFFVRLLTAHLR